MSMEIPDLTKKQQEFNNLSEEEQKKTYTDDWEEAHAVDKVLTKEITPIQEEQELNKLMMLFGPKGADNNKYFSNEDAEKATVNLESSVELIRANIYEALRAFKNGGYEIRNGITTEIERNIEVPYLTQHPEILKYIAKQLGGKIRMSEEDPQKINAVTFINDVQEGYMRKPSGALNNTDIDKISFLGLFPTDGSDIKMRLAIRREKQK